MDNCQRINKIALSLWYKCGMNPTVGVGIEKNTNFIAPLLILLHFIDFKDTNANQIKN